MSTRVLLLRRSLHPFAISTNVRSITTNADDKKKNEMLKGSVSASLVSSSRVDRILDSAFRWNCEEEPKRERGREREAIEQPFIIHYNGHAREWTELWKPTMREDAQTRSYTVDLSHLIQYHISIEFVRT